MIQSSHVFDFRRGMALLLIVLLTVDGVAMAAPQKIQAPVHSDLSPPFLDPDHIQIPEEMGSIQERYSVSQSRPSNRGKGSKTVVLIQDAHAVTSAQNSILNIINDLRKKNGVQGVAVEGATGILDSVLLQSFPDRSNAESVLREYLKRGEVSGAGMAALDSDPTIRYFGIEKWDWYEKNYFAYLAALEARTEALKNLETGKQKLDENRPQVYSAALNQLHEAEMQYRKDPAAGLYAFIRYLTESYPEVSLKDYPEVDKLASWIKADQARSPEFWAKESRQMLQQFEQVCLAKLNSDLRKQFGEIKQSYLTQKNELVDFVRGLKEIALTAGCPEIHVSGPLKNQIQKSNQLFLINDALFIDQLRDYTDEIRENQIRTPEERELASNYQRISRLEDLARLGMSRKAWQEFDDAGLEREVPSVELFRPMIEFYRIAISRDQILARNFDAWMSKQALRSAMVVIGGFHEEGFKKYLKDAGYNYVVIRPKMTSIEPREHYEKLMIGKLSYRQRLAGSFYESFMKTVGFELISCIPSAHIGPVVKSWRDNLLRRLSEEGRIAEAHRDTRLIDEIIKEYREYNADMQWDLNREELIRKIEIRLNQFRDDVLSNQNLAIERPASAAIAASGQLIQPANLALARDVNVSKRFMEIFRRSKPEGNEERFPALRRNALHLTENVMSDQLWLRPEMKSTPRSEIRAILIKIGKVLKRAMSMFCAGIICVGSSLSRQPKRETYLKSLVNEIIAYQGKGFDYLDREGFAKGVILAMSESHNQEIQELTGLIANEIARTKLDTMAARLRTELLGEILVLAVSGYKSFPTVLLKPLEDAIIQNEMEIIRINAGQGNIGGKILFWVARTTKRHELPKVMTAIKNIFQKIIGDTPTAYDTRASYGAALNMIAKQIAVTELPEMAKWIQDELTRNHEQTDLARTEKNKFASLLEEVVIRVDEEELPRLTEFITGEIRKYASSGTNGGSLPIFASALAWAQVRRLAPERKEQHGAIVKALAKYYRIRTQEEAALFLTMGNASGIEALLQKRELTHEALIREIEKETRGMVAAYEVSRKISAHAPETPAEPKKGGELSGSGHQFNQKGRSEMRNSLNDGISVILDRMRQAKRPIDFVLDQEFEFQVEELLQPWVQRGWLLHQFSHQVVLTLVADIRGIVWEDRWAERVGAVSAVAGISDASIERLSRSLTQVLQGSVRDTSRTGFTLILDSHNTDLLMLTRIVQEELLGQIAMLYLFFEPGQMPHAAEVKGIPFVSRRVHEHEKIDLGKMVERGLQNPAVLTGNRMRLSNKPADMMAVEADAALLPEKLKRLYYQASLALLMLLTQLGNEERAVILRDQTSLERYIQSQPHLSFIAPGMTLEQGNVGFDPAGFISALKKYDRVAAAA